MERWLNDIWYRPRGVAFVLLWPLSLVFRLLSRLRRFSYEAGVLKSHRLSTPVIVVGNLTAGGTGKTPVVLWLVDTLRARGMKPGVISRGYRGSAGRGPMVVDAGMRAGDCGDEPLMIRRRSECPVVVGSDRVAAARKLLESGCDVIVADDGLQHLRLQRDLELVVVDGSRGFGNRGLLPAGPMREPATRLGSVDAIIVNGGNIAIDDALKMKLTGKRFHKLDGSQQAGAEDFDGPVHAVAGIGHPQRFFDALTAMGLDVIPHAFPDHHDFEPGGLDFGDGRATIMTEKDAIRIDICSPENLWYLPVTATFSVEDEQSLQAIVASATKSHTNGSQ